MCFMVLFSKVMKGIRKARLCMRIAICDDNKAIIDSVRKALMQCINNNSNYKIDEFYSGESLLNYYNKGGRYDLIFLDIQMEEINGINTAFNLKRLHKDVMLIFLTGHSIYVREAFTVQAFQYLTKPVNQEEIIKEFRRAVEHYKLNHTKYKIEDKRNTVYIEISNIIYMEVRNHMITIYTEKGEYIVKGKLKDEENKLSKYDFVRCHQGYLVNMQWIHAIYEDNIQLKTGISIPVSRRMRKNVINIFSNYIVGRCI